MTTIIQCPQPDTLSSIVEAQCTSLRRLSWGMALSGALSILVTWFSIYLGGPLSYGVMQFWYCIVGFLQLQRARETVANHEQHASSIASGPKENFLVLCNLNAGGFVLALVNLFVELQAFYTYAVFGSSVPRAISLG
jgi:hypothetical protein